MLNGSPYTDEAFMGDTRFRPPYARIRRAADQARELQSLSDEEVIAALAAASGDADPYLANVLATEALNRTHVKSALIETAGEAMFVVGPELDVTFLNRAARLKLALPLNEEMRAKLTDILVCADPLGRPLAFDDMPVVRALRGNFTLDAVDGRIQLRDGTSFPASWTCAPIRIESDIEGAVFVFRDISARHASDEKLRKSETLLRSVVTGAPVILFAIEKDGRIALAEGRALEALGHKPEEVAGLYAFELGAAGFRIEEAARRALAGETVEAVIDAGDYSFQTRWAPVSGRGGEVEGIVGVATDITGLRLAEVRARRARSLLEATLNSTEDGLLVVDAGGRIRRYNDQFVRMWRIPPEALLAEDDAVALAAASEQLKDPAGFLARVHELYAHPEIEAMDVLEFKDGRTFERYTRPQMMEGAIVGRVWSFRDVTAHVRRDRQLRESEQRFRSLFEHSLDALVAVDLAGSITDVNPASCRLLGYARDELVGKNVRSLISPDTRAASFAEGWQSMDPPGSLRRAALIHRDGHRIEVIGAGRPILVDGKIVGSFGMARPIEDA